MGIIYFVIVDGYNGVMGLYIFNVVVCVLVCDGKVCGFNGCGGNCVFCDNDIVCISDG